MCASYWKLTVEGLQLLLSTSSVEPPDILALCQSWYGSRGKPTRHIVFRVTHHCLLDVLVR